MLAPDNLSKKAIFEISNIQLDSEAVSTETIETRWNECGNYLHIIQFPLSLSSLPYYQVEFSYIGKGLLSQVSMRYNCLKCLWKKKRRVMNK